MDAERWSRIETLFHAALEREEPERSRFLDAECERDPELRREVEGWLAADGGAPAQLAAAVGNAVRSLRTAFAPGARLGAYEILDLLGEGGMGSVYKARRSDDVFDKQVAIKVVKRGLASRALLERFRRERQILARLEHPYVARVLDGGSTSDGLPYVVMEYVDGLSLLDYARNRQLDLKARLRLFSLVCEAVAYAHQQQIVHRDLKPNNILVDAEGRPRLLDFGIAKLVRSDESPAVRDLTSTGSFGMLTPRYASPEHVKGEPITAASDVYSLGVIFYELLTGCAVHRTTGDSPGEIVKAVCDGDVAAPSRAAAAVQAAGGDVPIVPDALRGDIDRIALQAIAKDPRRRYESVAALKSDIERYLAAQPTGPRSRSSPPSLIPSPRYRVALMLIAISVLTVVGIVRFGSKRLADAPLLAPAEKIMLAVLPLENLTGHPEQDYFIDGLHEEIIARLGQLQPERLGVIARTSTLQYKGTRKSIAAIGHELKSQYVLEGSVRLTGRRLRVTSQLIQVSDQAHVWAESFERELNDLFSVQAEIGARVAERLSIDVLPEAVARIEPHRQLSPELHATYLRGKYLYERRSIDPVNLQLAFDAFRKVVEGAPGFAEGHAALGRAYRYRAIFADSDERAAMLESAKKELTTALAMDTRLAEAYSALSGVRFVNDWDWRASEEAGRQAVRLAPNSASSHASLALVLTTVAMPDEAAHEIRLALQLSPRDPVVIEWAYYVYLCGRRWEEAESAARQLAELVPGSATPAAMLGQLLALRGDCPRALTALTAGGVPFEPAATIEGSGTAYVFGRCGSHDAVARHVASMEKHQRNHASTIATVHAAAGNRTSALAWLEESFRRREEAMAFVATDPTLDSVRGDPRFEALLRRMQLPVNRP